MAVEGAVGEIGAAGASAAAVSSRWIAAARWAAVVGVCAVMVSPPLGNAAIVVMLVCFFASGQSMARLRQAVGRPLAVGAAAVVAVVALGMLWSDVSWSDRLQAFYTWRRLWIIPVVLALFGPTRWKQRMIVAFVALCAVAVIVSFGIVAAAGRLPTALHDSAGSLLRNHSAQSMAFAVGAMLSLWLAGRPDLGKLERGAAAASVTLLVLNMTLVTPGRSGYLALAVMLLVFAAASLRRRRNFALVAMLAALFTGALVFSPLARDRLDLAVQEWQSAQTAGKGASMGVRAILYENTLELVRERPWFGVGSGGFGPAYAAHVKDKYTDWRAFTSADPHSQYLFFLAEQGILGLLVFLSFIALALADRGDGGATRLIAVAMLLAWCATSLLNSHFQTFAEGHLLAFFLAAMLARPVPGLDRSSGATG
jgi:O-antigen ligase